MKQEAKKLLAYVMALSVMVSAILSGSLPAQAATLSPTENNNISISKNEDGITVYTLTSNVTDGLSLTLADGETVILDGNGLSVSGQDVGYNSSSELLDSTPALTLSGNGTLILKNINLSGGNGVPWMPCPTYSGSVAVKVDSESISLILQDTVTMTGGAASSGSTTGERGTDGSPGMIFNGDSLIVDNAGDVSITGSAGYDGHYSGAFDRPVSGARGADGLQFSSGSLTVHSGAKLTITGGNGGKSDDTRVSSGNGGNAMSFNGNYYSAASDANVTFNVGQAGSITSDTSSDKSGNDGKILSYTNGLFQDQTLLKSALSDDTETVTVKLHYPTETQIWYAKKDTTLNTSKLPDSDYYTVYGCYSDASFSTPVASPYTLASDTDLYLNCTPPTYQVSFITDDDSIAIRKQEVTYPASAAKPTGLSKTGYTLDGWYTDQDCTNAYDFSSKVTENITLYAKWNINSYKVSFDSNGGSDVAAQSVNYKHMASIPTAPILTGYTFVGWFADKDCTNAYDFNSEITDDIILHAKWDINYYKVSFDSQGGSDVATQFTRYNGMVSKPADPTLTGYAFAGWYTDKNCTNAYDFRSKVTGNISLYAKWNIAYTVSFDSNGGSSIANQSVESNHTASKPANPSKTGFTFAGWFTDKDCTTAYDFNSKVTGDITLYAKWNINSCTVSFDSNGGSSVAAQSVNYNTAVSKPADASKTGFTFAGWFTDNDCTTAYDFSSKVTGDITLYAKWNINSYKVSFDSNGGSSVAAQSVNYNTSASKPADPSRKGYTFAGWFTGKDCKTAYDFNSNVTGDITLYAKWNKIPDQSLNTPTKYKVSLNASSIPLQKGKSTTAVKATLTKGDSIAKWKSSNNKIATVDKKGKITAKKTGTATITVRTKKGATASVKVKVQKGKVTTKKLTITNVTDKKLTLKKGKTFKIKTSVTPITSPDKISYASSNKKIVTVDKKGKLKAVKKGTATITVKSGKKTVKFKVTVKK